MSVQNEITRLQTAKSAIVTSITSKGVTVPEGTTLDSMAGYITQISDIPGVTFSIYNGGLRMTYDDGM